MLFAERKAIKIEHSFKSKIVYNLQLFLVRKSANSLKFAAIAMFTPKINSSKIVRNQQLFHSDYQYQVKNQNWKLDGFPKLTMLIYQGGDNY